MPSDAASFPFDLDPVAADERDVLDTRLAQLSRDQLRPGAQLVRHHDDALEHPVDPDEDLRAPAPWRSSSARAWSRYGGRSRASRAIRSTQR